MNIQKLLVLCTKAFLFMLPWQTVFIFAERYLNGAKWQYGTIQFFATEVLLWFTITIFMLWRWKQVKRVHKEHSFSWTKDRVFLGSLFLLFLYSLVGAYTWTLDQSLALQHSLYVVEAIFLFLIISFGPITLREVLMWMVGGLLIPAVLGIIQFSTQSTFASTLLGLSLHDPLIPGTSVLETAANPRLLRAYGTFAHPNVFGGYTMLGITALLLLLFNEKSHKQYRYMVCGIGLLAIVALLFSFSRSAWLSFMLLCMVSFVFSVKMKRVDIRNVTVVLCFAMVLLLVVYQDTVFHRFVPNNAHEQEAITERVDGYAEALVLFRQNAVLGVGVGNYTAAQYIQLDSTRPGWEYQPVHNVPLLVSVEWGMIGMLLILYALYRYWIEFKVVIRKYLYLYVGGMLIVLPIMLFDHYLYSSYVGIMLCALYMGLITKCAAVHK